MIKKNNKITHSAVSIMLSVALAMSSANISGVEFTKSVSAATINNPVDTGNGYEYSTGRAIGMTMGSSGEKRVTEAISNIVLDEYGITNVQYTPWGGGATINIEIKNMQDDIMTIAYMRLQV